MPPPPLSIAPFWETRILARAIGKGGGGDGWSLDGSNLFMCADHNSLVVQHRDVLAPPEFEHHSALQARQ